MRSPAIVFVIASFVCGPIAAHAQSSDPQHRVELLGQYAGANSSEFQGTDSGGGALIVWHPADWLGAEAEMNVYPKNLTVKGGAPFSRGRVEGLFGITFGPLHEHVRPFGTFKTGFVRIASAPSPIACPAIFPPILACELSRGEAVLATFVGGGVELFPIPRAVVRVDLGDRLMHYPGAAIDAGGTAHDMAFYRSEFRFAVGAGMRF